jgi:hypothetical protein
MKLSEFKQLIRKEAKIVLTETKQPINEGIIDKIIAAIIDKIIKTKYKPYFDALHNDPEYKEALKGLKNSVEKIDQSAENYKKSYDQSKADYDAYAKKYGKKAAEKMIDKLFAGKSYARWKPKY